MNEAVIDALIDLNYPGQNLIELHERKITFDEYLKKIIEWRDKKLSNDTSQEASEI